jgi:ubiquinone/menaquinone biosynthesis C-methylase UbiE
MPTFEEIYARYAAEYEALVAREDHQSNLLSALQSIIDLNGIDVVEMGAGTGRVTRLLAPFVRSIKAFDASAHMLSVAEAVLRASGLSNWEVAVADNKALPVPSQSSDLVIEGWSFGHATVWHADRWREEVDLALAEMMRAARPNATVIVIETLGTGELQPKAPSHTLGEFYAYLENERGFSRHEVQTDYRFESVAEAVKLARFFFGEELGERIERERWQVVPEWTGIWHSRRA